MIQFDDHIFQIGWFNHQLDTLQGTNISPQNGTFEDDFPFPQVGYVNPLEGNFTIWKLHQIDVKFRLEQAKVLTVAEDVESIAESTWEFRDLGRELLVEVQLNSWGVCSVCYC